MSQYHVMSLTVSHQVILRACLDEFFKNVLEDSICAGDSNGTIDYLSDLYSTVSQLNSYLVGPATPEPQAKLLSLNSEFMAVISQAVEKFNPGDLDEELRKVDRIKAGLPKLRELVRDSLKFSYTKEEIQSA